MLFLDVRCLILQGVTSWMMVAVPAMAANQWPQWRGPSGTGVSTDRSVPIFWNEHRSIAWKTEVSGWGTSTPVIWNNAVFLTSHTDDGQLLAMRIDKRTGQVLWKRGLGTARAVREAPKRQRQKFHQLHNLASPSPVTDGQTVVFHFGNGDLAAMDFSGELLWKRNLEDDFEPYTIWWGHANSPVIYGDSVISVCMQDSLSDQRTKPVESYVIAHRIQNGTVKWKTTRTTAATAEECDAYTTPLLISARGIRQLVVMGGNRLDAYAPETGELLWKLPGLVGGRTVTGPTFDGTRLYATRGMRGPLLAVQPGNEGDELTRRDIQWQYTQGTPDTCCPVIWKSLLFTVSDDGIARCFDATTGKLHWKERLAGKYKASPVAVDGRIYFLNTTGLCSVISASSRFNLLTENQLDDETIASPAVSDHHIFIRGRRHLYAIGQSGH